MNTKKILALSLSVLMAGSMLAACSSGNGGTSSNASSAAGSSTADSSTASGNTNSGEPITITVTRWGEVKDNDVEKTLIDKFNTENDMNITVKYDVVPGDGYGDRLTTSFSSGEGYDIFASGEGDFYKWVDKSLSASLDDLIANDTEYKSTMAQSILDMGKINGQQHYMVKDYNPLVLWYNKDMFDKQGVAYPTDSWTWDDLMAAAAKLTYKDDDGKMAYGFNAQSWNYAVQTYLRSLDLDIANEDGTEVEGFLNSDAVVAALDKYFGMANGTPQVSPSSADLDSFGGASAMLNNGKLAMYISGGWERNGVRDAGTNYATALVPGNHKSVLCAAGYSIGTRCKNPEAAWEVLKLITGEEATTMRSSAEGEFVLPTTDTQLEVVKGKMSEADQALIKALDYSVQPIGLRSALGNTIATKFDEAMEQIIFKTAPTKEILDNAVAEIKAAE